jgi:hypothetical protein
MGGTIDIEEVVVTLGVEPSPIDPQIAVDIFAPVSVGAAILEYTNFMHVHAGRGVVALNRDRPLMRDLVEKCPAAHQRTKQVSDRVRAFGGDVHRRIDYPRGVSRPEIH